MRRVHYIEADIAEAMAYAENPYREYAIEERENGKRAGLRHQTRRKNFNIAVGHARAMGLVAGAAFLADSSDRLEEFDQLHIRPALEGAQRYEANVEGFPGRRGAAFLQIAAEMTTIFGEGKAASSTAIMNQTGLSRVTVYHALKAMSQTNMIDDTERTITNSESGRVIMQPVVPTPLFAHRLANSIDWQESLVKRILDTNVNNVDTLR